MPKKYFHNDTDRVMLVGGVMIPNGEGREVDTIFLPPELLDEPAADGQAPSEEGDDPDSNLRAVLDGTLREIEPLLEDFSNETLKRLAELEAEADTPRKTLLEKLTELQLKRAAAKTGEPT